jgi:hypothetical protein
MEKRIVCWAVLGVVLGACTVSASVIPKLKPKEKIPNAAPGTGSAELRVDDLKTPLGIDDPTPRFSWQVLDPARGAKQMAYQVEVASSAEILSGGTATRAQ